MVAAMDMWSSIGEAMGTAKDRVGSLVTALGARIGGIADPQVRRQVAFTVAIIALSAKMAKADGVVTADEVAAFRTLFAVPTSEARHVARLFDIAKRDVAGFQTYASQVAALYGNDRQGLEDVIDGLFAIAKADGAVHEAELVYLGNVAAIFGFAPQAFERIMLRHVVPEEGDPYAVLGASRDWSMREIRAHYLRLVAEHHPDKLIARGVPADFTAANSRMAVINTAFGRIEQERGRT
jgi:DnaJ like chaperone protein